MKTSITKKVLLWGGFLILFVLLLSWNRIFPAKATETISNPETLPGIQTGDAPWTTDLSTLASRLVAIGLPALSQEGTVLHIHQHLDIFVDGQTVTIPAGVGINEAAQFISPIHVHDTTGVIHVESPQVQTFTLGQFFDIWGVLFTTNCIGGYCADATNTLSVYVNGVRTEGDPRTIPLTQHEEITIVFGTASSTQSIPSSYTFAPGL